MNFLERDAQTGGLPSEVVASMSPKKSKGADSGNEQKVVYGGHSKSHIFASEARQNYKILHFQIFGVFTKPKQFKKQRNEYFAGLLVFLFS